MLNRNIWPHWCWFNLAKKKSPHTPNIMESIMFWDCFTAIAIGLPCLSALPDKKKTIMLNFWVIILKDFLIVQSYVIAGPFNKKIIVKRQIKVCKSVRLPAKCWHSISQCGNLTLQTGRCTFPSQFDYKSNCPWIIDLAGCSGEGVFTWSTPGLSAKSHRAGPSWAAGAGNLLSLRSKRESTF